ncbi:MAG: hypothetical protein ACRD47_14035 [Nitrososphaeraceae archaeon]
MGGFKSILSLLFVASVLALAFAFHDGFFFLAEDGERTSALALPTNSVYPLSYDEDDDLEPSDITNYAQGADKITPLSSSNFAYSVSPGISVQQNVSQQNICSSNTAYCYNEVDNDFNVNPP